VLSDVSEQAAALSDFERQAVTSVHPCLPDSIRALNLLETKGRVTRVSGQQSEGLVNLALNIG
jgi:hypothetical protein